MNTQKNNSSSNKTMNLIIVLIIIVVLAAGIWAVYPKIADNLLEKSIADGTAPQTVETYAKQAGLSVEDYLTQYGLTDKVSEDTLWTDAQLLIPLGIYIGGNDFVEEFKTYYGLDASVTADTPWGELKDIVAEKDAQMAEEMANATEAPAETEATDAPAEDEAAAEATEAPAAE